jgi:hypothetical protein
MSCGNSHIGTLVRRAVIPTGTLVRRAVNPSELWAIVALKIPLRQVSNTVTSSRGEGTHVPSQSGCTHSVE